MRGRRQKAKAADLITGAGEEESSLSEPARKGNHFLRFQIEGFVGRGGTADVYRAYDPKMNREVALRLVRMGMDPELLITERTGIELQGVVGRIAPQVAEVFEFGETEDFFFAAIELVKGTTLAELLAAGKPLPLERSIAIAIELCRFLEVLHNFSSEFHGRRISGIIHGDIKPHNVVIAGNADLRILDFGVAKSISMTRAYTKNVFASIPYAAPERLRDGRVDTLTDLWSVAIILYEMVSGGLPFSDGSSIEIVENEILRADLRPLPSKVPLHLARIVLKALHPNPQERFSSAATLRQALEEFAEAEDFPQWKQIVASLPEAPREALAAVYDHRTRRLLRHSELKARMEEVEGLSIDYQELYNFVTDVGLRLRQRLDTVASSVDSLRHEFSDMRALLESGYKHMGTQTPRDPVKETQQ